MDLVTLSACETALGNADATGKEIEGFGVLAQELGAKAVIASLWNVSDESTSQLMQEFYRLRAAQPRKTKAEALRLAQLALLNGNNKGSGASDKDRGIRLDIRKTTEKGNYAHPYFWGPFILIGNWK
jgi:CHAT domain-containing protein